jgi:hypothetical protein
VNTLPDVICFSDLTPREWREVQTAEARYRDLDDEIDNKNNNDNEGGDE